MHRGALDVRFGKLEAVEVLPKDAIEVTAALRNDHWGAERATMRPALEVSVHLLRLVCTNGPSRSAHRPRPGSPHGPIGARSDDFLSRRNRARAHVPFADAEGRRRRHEHKRCRLKPRSGALASCSPASTRCRPTSCTDRCVLVRLLERRDGSGPSRGQHRPQAPAASRGGASWTGSCHDGPPDARRAGGVPARRQPVCDLRHEFANGRHDFGRSPLLRSRPPGGPAPAPSAVPASVVSSGGCSPAPPSHQPCSLPHGRRGLGPAFGSKAA